MMQNDGSAIDFEGKKIQNNTSLLICHKIPGASIFGCLKKCLKPKKILKILDSPQEETIQFF